MEVASVPSLFTFSPPAAPILLAPPAAEAITPLPQLSVFGTSGLSTAANSDVAPPSPPRDSFSLYSGPDVSCIATHAQRNPQMLVQYARVHPIQSDALKATAELRRHAEREKRALLATDLSALMEKHHGEMEDLAIRHATSVEYLDKLLNYTPNYQHKVRAINIENAKIHAKGEEVNAGKLQYPLHCNRHTDTPY
jgi:hypothetical protein